MIARAATMAWLVLVWVGITESVSVASVAGGVVLAGFLMVAFSPSGESSHELRVHPLALARCIGYFVTKLVQANIDVARAVIAPRRAGVRRAIVAVELPETPPLVRSLLATAVSLTPGTTIVEYHTDPTVFYVHVLQFRAVDEVRIEVIEMQRQLVRALAVPALLAEVDAHRARIGARRAPEPPAGTGDGADPDTTRHEGDHP